MYSVLVLSSVYTCMYSAKFPSQILCLYNLSNQYEISMFTYIHIHVCIPVNYIVRKSILNMVGEKIITKALSMSFIWALHYFLYTFGMFYGTFICMVFLVNNIKSRTILVAFLCWYNYIFNYGIENASTLCVCASKLYYVSYSTFVFCLCFHCCRHLGN